MELLGAGDLVPDDTIVLDREGRERPLRALLGRGGILLYFMRSGSCEICQAHVRQLARDRALLESDGRIVVALVPDSPASAALAAKQTGDELPIYAAPGLYVAFGYRRVLFGGIQQSGTVTIDRSGRIQTVHRASLPVNALDRIALHA